MKWDVQSNGRWKTAIPGEGWSSPIVQDGCVFLTTAVPSEEDPPRQQSLRALCLDTATGKTVWDVEVFAKQMKPDEKINAKNSFASPTPITDGDHVFVHFGPDGTACLDRDGKLIWATTSCDTTQCMVRGDHPSSPAHGSYCSATGQRIPSSLLWNAIRNGGVADLPPTHGVTEMVIRHTPGDRGGRHTAARVSCSPDGLQLRSGVW